MLPTRCRVKLHFAAQQAVFVNHQWYRPYISTSVIGLAFDSLRITSDLELLKIIVSAPIC